MVQAAAQAQAVVAATKARGDLVPMNATEINTLSQKQAIVNARQQASATTLTESEVKTQIQLQAQALLLIRIRRYIDTYNNFVAEQRITQFDSFLSNLLTCSTSAMQFNRGKRSGSDSTKHKMLLLDVLFTAFFGENSRNPSHKPIACNTLWGVYLSDKKGFVSKCFSSPPSQEFILNNDSFYLFLFMEYCPDADSAASLLKLVTSCCNHLHQTSSQAHNIEHTKTIVCDTFKDACIYVKQGIGILRTNSVINEILNSEKSIKFLDVDNKGDRNFTAFIRRIDFLMSHFLFYTVLSFIQDVGLFPKLEPYDWTLPGPSKQDQPQECNLLKYINHCLTDKTNIGRVHFQNSIGKSFIRCVCERKFPSSYLQFRQQGFTAFVVEFNGWLFGEKKLFQFFFGNVLAAGIDTLIEGEVALFMDPQEKAVRKKRKKPKTGMDNGNEAENDKGDADEDEKEIDNADSEDKPSVVDDASDENSLSSSTERTDEDKKPAFTAFSIADALQQPATVGVTHNTKRRRSEENHSKSEITNDVAAPRGEVVPLVMPIQNESIPPGNSEIKIEITEIKSNIADLKAELQSGIVQMKSEISGINVHLHSFKVSIQSDMSEIKSMFRQFGAV